MQGSEPHLRRNTHAVGKWSWPVTASANVVDAASRVGDSGSAKPRRPREPRPRLASTSRRRQLAWAGGMAGYEPHRTIGYCSTENHHVMNTLDSTKKIIWHYVIIPDCGWKFNFLGCLIYVISWRYTYKESDCENSRLISGQLISSRVDQ